MTVTTDDTGLTFAFPGTDDAAEVTVRFLRTLRVPDDDTTYGLPPGLGSLDVVAAADVAGRAEHGAEDFLLPMWQSEATWIAFEGSGDHRPFLLRMSVGGVNAVTGEPFTPHIDFDAEDYIEVPTQPWLDGFRVDDHTVRQFVAAPLGSGYTVAEQLTGSDNGTIRIEVTPLRADVWRERRSAFERISDGEFDGIVFDCMAAPPAAVGGMGLGAGGTITQSIATPIEPHENWDTESTMSATVRIVDSAAWQELTGQQPHREPLTIAEYRSHGFPWFVWYDDSLARQGDSPFSTVTTVREVGNELGQDPLPDNESFVPPTPLVVGP